jgi:hypothetical protein
LARNDKLFQRRKATSEESLRRRQAFRETYKRVLVVCEGARTEVSYFRELLRVLQLVSVDVEICAEGSAPISVVAHAEARCRAEGATEDAGYDAVFCVFDRDAHESYEEAKMRILEARKTGVFPKVAQYAITSVPCFEYWLLIHFQFSRSPFASGTGKSAAERVVASLRKIQGFEHYDKVLTAQMLQQLTAKVGTAERNASLALKDAENTGEMNPSTMVHELVAYLRSLRQV